MSKTPTATFIKYAIKGGWEERYGLDKFLYPQIILLDPSAWSAVGKALEWKMFEHEGKVVEEATERMHDFLDHLIEGKTIDDSLAGILQVDKEV